MSVKFRYFGNGNKRSEIHRDDQGELHYADGPAVNRWLENGELDIMEWYYHGDCHRLDGPAFIALDIDGERYVQQFWIKGKQVAKSYFQELGINHNKANVDDFNMVLFHFGLLELNPWEWRK